MLDNETKQRINTARDILVGKVPDPKSQVEQITIALIYKFMDDMDLEAEELGGHPNFFTGEYEKYGWRKIFDPALGGHEMLGLYGDAITRMALNPNLPQLFRDIFKNAYLPYRDPETLKSFLKIINDFNYDQSEKLGDAFEYLLSVLGSQGDAGQFRTPRHIIDFMTAILNPRKTESILDPACGTAGFLISAFKHILKFNSSNYNPATDQHAFEQHGIKLDELTINGKKYQGDKLTPDDRTRLTSNIRGYDISPDMVRLSLVNLYLHGFPEPHIYEYDSLTSEDRWNEFYDVILANPPFMSPKGGIRPHKRFSVQSNRSEVLFVDLMAEHLTPGGRAAIVVPEGIIFQSGTAYKSLRKMLVDDYLVGVISLPAGVFNPYSGVKTSILWLDKSLARKTNQILFAKITADGFDLGAQRRPVKQNDMPGAFRIISQYKEYLEKGISLEESGLELADDGSLHPKSSNPEIQKIQIQTVAKATIAENGDYNLSGERYQQKSNENLSQYRTIELGDVAEIIRGITFGKKDQLQSETKDSIRVATTKAAQENGIIEEDLYHIPEKFVKDESKYLRNGDILISTANSLHLLGRTTFVDDLKIKVSFGAFMTLVRAKNDKILPLFLLQLLKTEKSREYFYANANTTTNISNLTFAVLQSFQIPLPPLSIQQEIVTEIEAYQKIIDGARQVVENYKPRITIDPNWETVELGEVCEINPKKSELKDISDDLEVSFVPMADINENQIDFTPKQIKSLGEVIKGYTYFKNDDVLLAKVTPCFENGKAGIAKDLINQIGFGSSEYYVFRPNEKILSTWIYLNIITDIFRENGKLQMTGTGGLQRVPKEFVSTYQIPLPPLEIQQQIVAQIGREQGLVNANKELIALMEQKIKDRIARVWGE